MILTSNFDDGLTKGLRAANVSYSLITDSNVGSANAIHLTRQLAQPLVEVCAYHGTVDDFKTDSVDPTPPTSMAARDLAHPFAPEMSTYINRVLSEVVAIENGLVVFVGHRGEDFYDLNLEIRNALGGAKSLVEREARQQRFVCVPHLGDLSSVSHFYEEALTKSGFVVLTDGGTEWLAGLFDAVSGKASPVTPQATIGASEVERRFVSQVDAVHPVNSPRRKDIATQCKSLLIDIEAGVLAAWSIVEHYRLESLGYPQDVIASFARPKGSRKFFDIPILDFLALQKEYQNFRDRFEALEKVRSAENALVDGLSLSLRLERLGAQARNVLAKPIPSMHKSLAAVLAAIAYDYAGLVAMRCMRAKPRLCAVDPSLDSRLAQILADIDGSTFAAGQEIRADRLFLASTGLAERAGVELDATANEDEGDSGRREEYKQSLSQIVGWQDWALAPAENRLRLDRVPFDEKLSKFDLITPTDPLRKGGSR